MTSNSTSKPAAFDDLIRMIYSTSLDPSKWTLVLERLDELSGVTFGTSSANSAGPENQAMSRRRASLAPRRSGRRRRRRSQDSLDAEIPDFRQILDEHLCLAMQISEKMSTMTYQQYLLQQVFDRLPDAVFILGRDRSILIANRTAHALLEQDDGLSVVNGALTAAHRPTADKLRALIAGIETGQPDRRHKFDALPIPKRSGGRPLHLFAITAVTTMEDNFAPFLAGKPSIFLVVSDPDQQSAPPEDRLTAIFGLTPAEAKLAAALTGGLSVTDYAEKAQITENTARWTLKQVQAKTDCRRQTDLVRLLAATVRVC
jgi:DNA-binding CsgD family transcriptional regulator/PAS domain-containing protein